MVDKCPAYMKTLDRVLDKTKVPCFITVKKAAVQFVSLRSRGFSLKGFGEHYQLYIFGLLRAALRHPSRLMIVWHHDLATEPLPIMRRAFEFLGLEFPDREIGNFLEERGNRNTQHGKGDYQFQSPESIARELGAEEQEVVSLVSLDDKVEQLSRTLPV